MFQSFFAKFAAFSGDHDAARLRRLYREQAAS